MVLCILGLAGSSAHADDTALLARADTVLSELRVARKARDTAAVAEIVPRIVEVHNQIGDETKRLTLRKALGALLRAKHLAAALPATIEGLVRIDDPDAAYLQMKGRLPLGKDKALSPLGRDLLAAMGRMAPSKALGRLFALASKAKSIEVRAAAIMALGGYGKSARRSEVFGKLMTILRASQPPLARRVDIKVLREWRKLAPRLVHALQQLTGRDLRSPRDWVALRDKHRGDPEGVFAPPGEIPAGTPALPGVPPWKEMRQVLRKEHKASQRERTCVADALLWLKVHQSGNGAWQAAGFARWRDGKELASHAIDGLGRPMYDVGVTGLALAAFLVAGYDGTGTGPLDAAVRRGLAYLKSVQDVDGCFGRRTVSSVPHVRSGSWLWIPESQQYMRLSKGTVERDRASYVYNHATATMAMIEAFALTGNGMWKACAQRGLDFIEFARNPYFGLRYGIKPGDNDTSVTSWMMLAVGCAQLVNDAHSWAGQPAPFRIDEATFVGAFAWLGKATDPDSGRVGYRERETLSSREQELADRFPPQKSEALTAAGMYTRIMSGLEPRKTKVLQLGANLCSKRLPVWSAGWGTIDLVYWHFGTLAMIEFGGKPWRAWREAIAHAVLDSQRSDTTASAYKGSWDPSGCWGAAGGRVYATALNTLTVLTPVRFPHW